MNKKGITLLHLARAAIAKWLAIPFETPEIDDQKWLEENAACFITLNIAGKLRGCIGSLQAHRPLLEDIQTNAINAAFKDPRFPPLTVAEFELIQVEVSILTPPVPIRFSSETDALAQLRPDIDGVILKHGYNTGTFLPQVWEQLPSPVQFMQHLKHKAGLASDFWSENIQLSRYEVEKFSENDLAKNWKEGGLS